jgi:hypothetical protein
MEAAHMSDKNELELQRAVGKFIYAAGSDVLLHFMALKPFHFENSVELSLLFCLRAMRGVSKGNLHGLTGELEPLFHKSSSRLLTNILKASSVVRGGRLWITDLDPGIGFLYECLKYAVESLELRAKLRYSAVLPPEKWHGFAVLHDCDEIDSCSYNLSHTEEPLEEATSEDRIIVWDRISSVRRSDFIDRDIRGFLADYLKSRCLLATDVISGPVGRQATLVSGRTVYVPSLTELNDMISLDEAGWSLRVFKNRDSDFFLPSSDSSEVSCAIVSNFLDSI